MEEISSYQLQLNQSMKTKDILEFCRFAKRCQSNIYLYRENVIADAKNLPKLLSFFLVTSRNYPIVMIVDGENAMAGYGKIKTFLKKQSIKAEPRSNHSACDNRSVVI